MRSIDDIISDAASILRPLLAEAFEAGRALGRQEGSDDIRKKLADVIGPQFTDAGRSYRPTLEQEAVIIQRAAESVARASPGSVKPVVLDFVRENPGLTQDQIREKTGIKHNSVRGTLWQLSTEKLIERRAGKWFPRSEENEASASETGEGGATNAAPA